VQAAVDFHGTGLMHAGHVFVPSVRGAAYAIAPRLHARGERTSIAIYRGRLLPTLVFNGATTTSHPADRDPRGGAFAGVAGDRSDRRAEGRASCRAPDRAGGAPTVIRPGRWSRR
jgi:hypothetical protein